MPSPSTSREATTALVVGKFAPLHAGHRLVLDAARDECDRVVVLVYSRPDFPAMPNEVRAGWVRALYPQARVLVPPDPPPDDADDDTHQRYVARYLASVGERVGRVYSSEPYGEPLARVLSAGGGPPVDHRAVDPARGVAPVSGTQIRADVHAHRRWLDPLVYAHFVEMVVFLGAESTGKTTLARRMAEELGTVWVPEYGRELWVAKGGRLTLEDYVHIAERHRQLEDDARRDAQRWVFVDTNAITTMFLCHAYEGRSHPDLAPLARAAETRYRHVILCADDIGFEQDGWRDDEVWRRRAQGMVRYDLAVRGVPYREVGGPLEQRVAAVQRILGGSAG